MSDGRIQTQTFGVPGSERLDWVRRWGFCMGNLDTSRIHNECQHLDTGSPVTHVCGSNPGGG